MGKFKKVFRKLPGSTAANALHELWQILFIALAAVLCGPRAAPTWRCLAVRRKSCSAAFPAALSTAFPATTRSAACFGLLDPEAFEKAFRRVHGGLRQSQRDQRSPASWRSTARRCVVPTSAARARNAAAHGQCLRRRSSDGSWPRARRPAATRPKARLQLARACSRSKAASSPADALHCNRPFAAAVLARGAHYVLALKKNQAKLFDAVVTPLCPWRQAQHSPTARTLHPRSPRNRGAPLSFAIPVWRAATAFPASLPWPASPRADAFVVRHAEKPVVRYYLLSKYIPAKRLLHDRAQSFGHREPVALGPRCRLRTRTPIEARKDNAPENLAILRRLALNIIRNAIHVLNTLCDTKSNAPAGTMPSFSRFSAICDSPPLEGEGRRRASARRRGGVSFFPSKVHPTPARDFVARRPSPSFRAGERSERPARTL